MAGASGYGGGAAGLERGWWAAVELVGVESCAGAPFIEQARRWRVGCAGGGRRTVRSALMASRHGGAGGDAAQRRRDRSGRR